MIDRFYAELDGGAHPALKCSQCGSVTLPPASACDFCGCPTPEPISITGHGELQNYCVLPAEHEAESADTFAEEGEEVRHAFGTVVLPEGRISWTEVVDVDLHEPWRANAVLPVTVEAAPAPSGSPTTVVFRPQESRLVA